jgi:hypothetical protein
VVLPSFASRFRTMSKPTPLVEANSSPEESVSPEEPVKWH